jgi:hypothetical protein
MMRRFCLPALAAASLLASHAVAQPPPLEALPQILQLQLSQHPAWRAYKDAAAETRADAAHQADKSQEFNSLPTPARLDALLDQMKAQQAAFEREAAATKAFYAVLSPEQRATFDQVTRLPSPPPQGYRPQRQGPPPASSTLRAPPPGYLPPPQNGAASSGAAQQ